MEFLRSIAKVLAAMALLLAASEVGLRPLAGSEVRAQTLTEFAPAPGAPPPPPGDSVFLAQDDLLPKRAAVRPARYQLAAELDPARHEIKATGTLSFTNTSRQALDHLFIHLYMNAFEHEKTVFRRADLPGFRGDLITDPGWIRVDRFYSREYQRELLVGGEHTPGDPDDRTDIRVALPTPLAPGASLTIDLAFVTKLPSIALRAGYAGSFHMAGQWFPKLAKLEPDGYFAHFPYERLSEFYSDFADYDVTISVPMGFQVGATGQLVRRSESDGVVAQTFQQTSVGDFAFAAWDGFEERTRNANGVELRCLFPAGHERAADRQLEAAERGLDHYGRTLGPYPYPTLTLVSPPPEASEAGGMEYPTLITTGGPFWWGYVPALPIEHLVLHELGHQWFYGLVASNENAFPFLDEGLTSYVAGEATRALYGRTLSPLADLGIEGVDRATPLLVAERSALSSGASEFSSGYDYGNLVYARTATVLRTLDRVWEGAGSRALGSYARHMRFAHPVPADLVREIESAAGAGAAKFFSQASFERAWVDFVAEAPTLAGDGSGQVAVVTRLGALEVPVEILLQFADGETKRMQWAGDQERIELSIPAGQTLVRIEVDPEARVLVEERRANNVWAREAAWFAPRSLAWATLASALLLSVGGP